LVIDDRRKTLGFLLVLASKSPPVVVGGQAENLILNPPGALNFLHHDKSHKPLPYCSSSATDPSPVNPYCGQEVPQALKAWGEVLRKA
jgi:hypothetical protein